LKRRGRDTCIAISSANEGEKRGRGSPCLKELEEKKKGGEASVEKSNLLLARLKIDSIFMERGGNDQTSPAEKRGRTLSGVNRNPLEEKKKEKGKGSSFPEKEGQ